MATTTIPQTSASFRNSKMVLPPPYPPKVSAPPNMEHQNIGKILVGLAATILGLFMLVFLLAGPHKVVVHHKLYSIPIDSTFPRHGELFTLMRMEVDKATRRAPDRPETIRAQTEMQRAVRESSEFWAFSAWQTALAAQTIETYYNP